MRSIRWKLILVSIGLVFIPVFLLNRYAMQFFDRFTRADLEENLRHYAFIAGEQYRDAVLAPGGTSATGDAGFGSMLKRWGTEVGARIQILSTNGVVLYDSADPPETGRSMARVPEVRDALRGAYSARARLTVDRQFMYYYIARPVKNEARNEVLAVSYVVRHTGPIIRAIQELIANQRLATELAIAIAALVAAVLAFTLTRRLRALTRASQSFAAGDARLDVRIAGGDEIAALGHAVRQMAAEIERRNRFNRDFVSATMHELKTPLTAIKGAAELLEHGAADRPESRAKFLANIRHQSERMIRLTGELLDLTRLDVEMLRGRKERVDYGAFVRETVERLQTGFDTPHAAMRLDLPAEPVLVLIAPHRIEQVIANLLENALRYTPPDGQVVIEVRRSPDNGHVVTRVSDTGCGIPPANLGRVFDRFFTTEPKGRPSEHGSGLGLAIARTIVENHRGRIRVESPWPPPTPGTPASLSGTAFFFTLPAARGRRRRRNSRHGLTAAVTRR